MQKTVVLVSNSTWNINNFRIPVIEALQKANYRVVVVAPVDEYVSAPGLRNVEKIPLHHLNRDSLGLWSNFQLFLEFCRLFKQIKPDLILHFTIKPNIFGNLAAAWLGIPSFCVVTGLGYTFLHKGLVQWASAQLYRFSFRYAKQVIFENEEDMRLMVERQLVNPERSRFVNGCGVDVRHFSPNGSQPQAGKMVFTFIGRLLFDKGVKEFVEAAKTTRKTCPEAEFWIVGGFDDSNPAHVERDLLLKWVQQDVVQYKGATDDVRPFISKSDWIVLPSYREGLSKVLLEAMSMAKPLITTDTAGCRETVENGKNGFLIPVGDSSQLSATFERCCHIPAEERKQMGEAGRQKAIHEFESSLIGRQYLNLIEKELNLHE